MEKTVLKMIDTLEAFQGAEYGGISVRKEEIKRKKLILILPENELGPLQETAIRRAFQYSMLKFIELDLQRYQKV